MISAFATLRLPSAAIASRSSAWEMGVSLRALPYHPPTPASTTMPTSATSENHMIDP